MKNIYLIGFMGAGKSTVAETLSTLLGCEYVDVDELIVQKSGMTINSIFEKLGETTFRDFESETLVELGSTQNLVVATGGGCVERSDNFEMMSNNGSTVYLQTPWEVIVARIAEFDHRPLAKNDDDWRETRERYLRRLPLYESADIVVDTFEKSPEAVSSEIISLLRLGS